MAWFSTLAASLLAFAGALAFRLALPLGPRRRAIAWLALSLAVALSPCLVPLAEKPARMAASMVAIAFLAKLYDMFRQPDLAWSLTPRAYVLYLINGFWLVLRLEPRRVPAAADRRGLALGVPLAAALAACFVGAFTFDWSATPFALEHAVKATIVAGAIAAWANCGARMWRLLGGVALDPMLRPALAPTIADFWRRWNRPAQQFFYEYGYLPAGGSRRPLRGILAAFVLSGVIHEYVFGVATGFVHGWQLLFFTIHGLATIATLRIRPRGWATVPWIAATLALNLLLAVLFFQSVDVVLPFYSPRRG